MLLQPSDNLAITRSSWSAGARGPRIDDNPFGIPADAVPNPSGSVADGYWVMLAPLAAGVHPVNVGGGGFCDEGEYLLTADATYESTVAR